MKKQYRISNNIGFKKYIYLYHDGKLVKEYSLWDIDLDNEIDKLKAEGYTLGYTIYEVEEAKLKYENRLKNKLVEPKGE